MAMRAAVQSQRGGDSPHQSYINNDELQDSGARAQGGNKSATKHSHVIPEEPARRGSYTSASLCLDGPTEKYRCIIPRTKSTRLRNSQKSWQNCANAKCESIPKPPNPSRILPYEDNQTAIFHTIVAPILFPISKIFLDFIFTSSFYDGFMITSPQKVSS
jgi:hypothetical protein